MVRATQTEIEKAVETLRAGDLVVFPTETVYGLGANASNPAAVRKIFEVKGRPRGSSGDRCTWTTSAICTAGWRDVPETAQRLASMFWPGPLTLILPKADNVNDIVTGGQNSIGIRIPSHPMALQLLTAFGGGIAAPSANRYGRLSPTKPEHVRDELGEAVEVILDGGDSPIGLESTIVSCLNNEVRLLRPGSITRSQLEQVVGGFASGGEVPRVPGDRGAALRAIDAAGDRELGRTRGEGRRDSSTGRKRWRCWRCDRRWHTKRYMTWINAGKKPDAYAHNLYNNLRTLDRAQCVRILVQELPPDERWAAILDRLQRASGLGEDPLELSAS